MEKRIHSPEETLQEKADIGYPGRSGAAVPVSLPGRQPDMDLARAPGNPTQTPRPSPVKSFTETKHTDPDSYNDRPSFCLHTYRVPSLHYRSIIQALSSATFFQHHQ